MHGLPLGWVRKHKWILLLCGIVTLLVISPIEEVYNRQDNIITPLAAVVIIAVTLGTSENRKIIIGMIALTLVWMVISIATEGSGLFADESLLAPLIFMTLLLALFILLARWLTRAIHINTEVLCAAICGYLLVGVLWTGLYAVVLVVDPAALVFATQSGLANGLPHLKIPLGDLLYFSFITLTTTGFGDIIPKDPVVRMLTVIEAIVGIYYNTIVIARFVSLYGLKLLPASQENISNQVRPERD